jgi:putative intracellular protease/amidase
MRTRHSYLGVGLTALVLSGCRGDVTVAPAQIDPAVTAQREREFVVAMKPRREGRPVIAVVARNAGTETTDLLLTHGALQRANVADVQVVAPRRGRVSLYPALAIDAPEDFASFAKAHPNGADYVIVPAMSDDADPEITSWLQQQSKLGARIIGVCVGALVVANADLLDGRRFTTHWFYRSNLLDEHPTAKYVPHQRYVIDGDVATTTGITASVPTMIALVEAIAGREKAQRVAADLGVDSWGPAHDSSQFGLNASRRWNYVLTKLAFWSHADWSVPVQDGIDDISLAFAADAWSRTGRVSVEAAASKPVKLRSGLILAAAPGHDDKPRMPLTAALKPVQQLDKTLCEIRDRFGVAKADRVMMELEYPASASACAR